MSLTARDRKILIALVPLAIVVAYWFLLLAPKRDESAKLQDQLTHVQSDRDAAVQKLAGLGAAKQSFARDYATVIYLGKSIPSVVDMPSLLVQLDRASRGTGIKFTSIKTGARSDSSGASGGGSPTGQQTSTPAQGASAPATGGAQGANPAFDTVPLDFQFDGSFFDLVDFFHRMKRFVRVANERILIRGRLMTVNSFTFEPGQDGFPHIKATVHATVYLAPKAGGVAAGATQQGPAGAQPAQAGQTASGSSSPAPTPPTATVTAR
jgi:hypothetical protein